MKRLAIAVTFACANAIAAISWRAQEKGIDVALANTPNALAGQNVPPKTKEFGKKQRRRKHTPRVRTTPRLQQGNPASPDHLDCGRLPVQQFVVDPSGSVSNTVQNLVGTACVEVFYDSIQNAVFLQSNNKAGALGTVFSGKWNSPYDETTLGVALFFGVSESAFDSGLKLEVKIAEPSTNA